MSVMSTSIGRQRGQGQQEEGSAPVTPSPRIPATSVGSQLESSRGRTTVAEVARQVREAVIAHVGGLPIAVTIGDLELPEERE